MPKRAMRCTVDVNIHAVFYTAFEPSQVVEALEHSTVLIELIQLSDVLDSGRLLAHYETPWRKLGFSRPTVSSISRSRSLSPSLYHRLDALDLQDSYIDESKPPFVVRKVDKNLIGRTPGGEGRDRFHGSRVRPLSSGSQSSLRHHTKRRCKSKKGKTKGRDLEVAQLTSADYGLYSRPRTTSPLLYRSSLSDRYDERPWSPAKSELISSRVERALRRNRSLERLDRLSPSPYTSPSSLYHDYEASLSELAHDLERAKSGRYYSPYS
ncbi:hypothetical protein LSH36_25g04038 [Paralvinella palmiformis]|uniref:Spermatogenesis-associated protein 6 N-terminal domain-containing protein n=1 Tax=Paralvinella palmiformis TaxID=53620 RepID=A0AAD9KBM1_9ANNE|nr:hypothetical protein LSH36_25g04038 [Paralvinella palmiformis]